MYTVFDMNHFGVKAPLEELVPIVKKHGIEGIHVPSDLLENKNSAIEATKLLFDHGIKWSLLPTPVDFFSEDLSDEEFDKGIEKLKLWASTGEKMGVRYSYNHVWNGSNTRETAENFTWVQIRLRQVWRVMNDYGIKYGMEFLGPWPLRNSFKYPFFNTISGIMALAHSVDPSCGFLFDSYHWHCGSNSSLSDVYFASEHVNSMVNFHINDGVPGRSWKEQEDMERFLPLETGVINSALPWKLFKENGYKGPVMCEPMRPWSTNPGNKPLDEVVGHVAKAYERVDQASKLLKGDFL